MPKPKQDVQPPGDLVVLIGGPRHRWWFTLDSFQHSRRAAERMGRTDGLFEYVETERYIAHPTVDGATGKAWRHRSVALPQEAKAG